MDKNEHVYCVNCTDFKIEENIPCCCHENECDITNCEDSTLFENRPFYKDK